MRLNLRPSASIGWRFPETAFGPPNVVTKTAAFNDASWTKNASSVTADATTAPDGSATADLIIAAATSGTHTVAQNKVWAAGTKTVISCYFKAQTAGFGFLTEASNVTAYAIFNLATGAVSLTGGSGFVGAHCASIGSGWYRAELIYTSAGVAANIQLGPSNGTYTWTGDGVGGIYAWGAQMETGSRASTYKAAA